MKMHRPKVLAGALLASTLSLGFAASPGLAFVDAQLLVGRDSATVGGNKIGTADIAGSGTMVKAAVHLDPIPLIPIAFGLGVSAPQIEGKDSANNSIKLEGMLVDLEIMAWSPISLLGLTPYVKAAYVVAGGYKADHSIENAVTVGDYAVDPSSGVQDYTYGFESSGHQLALGARYSLLPLIGILLEVSSRTEISKASDIKVAGTSLPIALDGVKTSATSVMLGVQLGL